MDTWILPKQLHTLASALDTAALSLDSSEQSQICAQSLFVRSKPSPSQIWLRKWKRDSWTRHLSGRILRPSLGEPFVTAWTSLLGDIPASPSAQPVSAKESKTRGISGRGLQMVFDFSDPGSASLRTSKDISAWGCPTSSKTWQEWVTERRGAYSARLNAAHRTSASGCSSWPSPVASEVRQGFQDRSRGMKGSQESLTTVVIKSWPTPAARDHKDTGENVDMKKVAAKCKLSGVVAVHGPAVPASSSTDGSRPGLSVDWRTPQANEAGAKVETLYTKDGQPAKPGQRAYRKTPDGRMVLQSQTINQQVEMVEKQWQTATVSTGAHKQKDGSMTDKLDQQVKSWATPDASDRRSDNCRQVGLSNQIKTWPTPASSGVTGGPTGLAGGAGNREKLAKMLPDAEARAMGCGKLNPRWVETLMGLPVGWTMPSCASPVTIEPTS
jgi:predicted transcriptional regulator